MLLQPLGQVITLLYNGPNQVNLITSPLQLAVSHHHVPGAECTTSPYTITRLSPSIEYVFTLTLNSGQCRINMSETMKMTWGKIEFGIGECRLVSAGLMYIHNSDLYKCIKYFC